MYIANMMLRAISPGLPVSPAALIILLLDVAAIVVVDFHSEFALA
jgi:hypothetical protein